MEKIRKQQCSCHLPNVPINTAQTRAPEPQRGRVGPQTSYKVRDPSGLSASGEAARTRVGLRQGSCSSATWEFSGNANSWTLTFLLGRAQQPALSGVFWWPWCMPRSEKDWTRAGVSTETTRTQRRSSQQCEKVTPFLRNRKGPFRLRGAPSFTWPESGFPWQPAKGSHQVHTDHRARQGSPRALKGSEQSPPSLVQRFTYLPFFSDIYKISDSYGIQRWCLYLKVPFLPSYTFGAFRSLGAKQNQLRFSLLSVSTQAGEIPEYQ